MLKIKYIDIPITNDALGKIIVLIVPLKYCAEWHLVLI